MHRDQLAHLLLTKNSQVKREVVPQHHYLERTCCHCAFQSCACVEHTQILALGSD